MTHQSRRMESGEGAVPCPQASLLEALRDGRLSPSDTASISRHIATCAACAREKRALDRIRDALRAPREAATELEHQRARGALLRAAANQGQAPSVSRSSRPRTYLMLAAAAAFVVGALSVGFLWGRSSAPSAVASSPAPALSADTSVVPSEGARFERTRGGGVDSVTLSSGRLSVATGTRTTERIIVKTTDAELESKDAAFHVDAQTGRIRSVVVERGSVEVRYAGFIAVIPAGGSWHGGEAAPVDEPPPATPAPQAVIPTSVAVAPAPPAPATPAPLPIAAPPPLHASAVQTARPVAPAAPPAPPTSEPVAVTPPPVPASGKGFSSAMRTMERGDFDGAATALRAFADAHPDDPRADDAEYVRAIALERAGRAADAKAAAQRYLANHPSGAHRAEARELANR